MTHLSLQIGSLELALVNVHVQAPESTSRTSAERPRLSHSLQEALRGAFPRRPWPLSPAGLTLSLMVSAGEKELVVLGDFGCSPQSSELDVLRKEKFCALVPPSQFTNISTRSPQGNSCLDNIWLSRSAKKSFSGKTSHSAAVIRAELPAPGGAGGRRAAGASCRQKKGAVANGNRHCGKRSSAG